MHASTATVSHHRALLLAAACALAAPLAAAQQQELVVRIAHVGPTSGPQAHYGKDNENGARMALDDLNARGVSIGGRKARFVLVAEDDAADPKQATAVANRLCDLRVNGIVGHLNSGTALPASRVYNGCGIPHVAPGATNPKLTQNGYKTTFRMLADDSALGAGLARQAARMNVKKVAIVDDRTAYGQGVAQVFRAAARELGMQVVDEQFTSDKAVDFSAILTAIKARAPDAVFYGGMDNQAGGMLRQMEQLGMAEVKLFGGDGVCTQQLPALAANAGTLANVVCAEGGLAVEKMAGGATWKARYDARFPGQFQVYSPYAYDAAMVIADAMVRAGSSDPKIYGAALFRTDYAGVTGRIRFEPTGDLKDPEMTLFAYPGGKRKPL